MGHLLKQIGTDPETVSDSPRRGIQGMPENPLSNENVAERLKVVRKAVAGTQTAFCKRIGIEVQRWNNFERGLPNSVGILLVQKIPGLTLHWLFLGKSGWVATPTSR